MIRISDRRIVLVILGIFILCIVPVLGALTDASSHQESSLHGWSAQPAHAIPAPFFARLQGTA